MDARVRKTLKWLFLLPRWSQSISFSCSCRLKMFLTLLWSAQFYLPTPALPTVLARPCMCALNLCLSKNKPIHKIKIHSAWTLVLHFMSSVWKNRGRGYWRKMVGQQGRETRNTWLMSSCCSSVPPLEGLTEKGKAKRTANAKKTTTKKNDWERHICLVVMITQF